MTTASSFFIFTTIFCKNYKAAFLNNHIHRLLMHARDCKMPEPKPSEIEDAINPLLTSTPSLLRVTIGKNGISSEARAAVLPTHDDYENGVQIMITQQSVEALYATTKTSRRSCYIKAKQDSEQAGAFEGLLLDDDGFVVDGTRSSPLLYTKDTLLSLQGGIEGITRNNILEYAKHLGIKTEKTKLRPRELKGTLLIAGSGIGLLAGCKIQDPKLNLLAKRFQLLS